MRNEIIQEFKAKINDVEFTDKLIHRYVTDAIKQIEEYENMEVTKKESTKYIKEKLFDIADDIAPIHYGTYEDVIESAINMLSEDKEAMNKIKEYENYIPMENDYDL